MVSVCTRSMSYSMFRRHAPSNAYLAFSGPGRQPEEQPQNFDQRRARNLLKTPAFAKPNRFGRGSLGKRQKPFRDRKSALRQSLRFGRLQQTPLKLGINSALWERRSGFATGNWRREGDWERTFSEFAAGELGEGEEPAASRPSHVRQHDALLRRSAIVRLPF